jgi:hypothetical protein
MKVYTPREYVLLSVGTYPTLCSAPTFDEVALKVFEQLFNVIGNGIRDHEELLEHIAHVEGSDFVTGEKFITSETLMSGYEKTRIIGKDFEIADGYASVHCLESEMGQHPEIKKWIDSRRYPWHPYPNYKEEYSIVYRSNFKELGNEWIDAAIWYYEQAQEYMKTIPNGYHGAYPTGDAKEDARLIKGYEEFMDKYKTNAEVSAAYGVEYNGNLEEMVAARWKKEHARINEFITNTINYLKEMKT